MTETAIVSRPSLILLASDQEWAARSLESILGPNGYAVLRAYTARQAVSLARTARPDALILDARLPDMSGIEACELLRVEPRLGATTPIIVTTSGADLRAQRLAAYQAGAWEFYSQPLDAELLLAKLATYIRSKRQADRIRDESLVDELTGLYNMRGLTRRAREIGAQAQRRRDPVACVAIAPDSVPADSPEAPLDEAMAEQLAVVIRRTGRVSDIVGRIGPSEFAIIAPATDAGGAARLVERVRENAESVQTTLPHSAEGSAPGMQIRAGYHAVPDFADSPVDVGEILLRATAALRHVRSEGDGERVRAFDALPLRRGQ
ncbi:MAG: response regulator [Gemmatimonadaceae bacterium]